MINCARASPVALQHQHVAVAGDTEVAEVDEVGFSSVRVQPIGDRVGSHRTRVTEVVCAGSGPARACCVAEIHDAQLAAGNIAPFQQQPCRDRIERGGVAGDLVARKQCASADERVIDEIVTRRCWWRADSDSITRL